MRLLIKCDPDQVKLKLKHGWAVIPEIFVDEFAEASTIIDKDRPDNEILLEFSGAIQLEYWVKELCIKNCARHEPIVQVTKKEFDKRVLGHRKLIIARVITYNYAECSVTNA